MAVRFAGVFGTEPEIWVNPQAQYDLWLVRQQARRKVQPLHKRARGSVNYFASWEYREMDPHPGDRMFIKPDIFRPEHEFRMYWVVSGVESVERRTFDCPEIAQYCKVLDD